jgi:phytoene dehydrogenase-like protein
VPATGPPAARDALGNRVTAAIAAVAPGFGELVRHCEVLTPVEIEQRYGLTEGAPTQGEMTLDQILFMRPVAGRIPLCHARSSASTCAAPEPIRAAASRVVRGGSPHDK